MKVSPLDVAGALITGGQFTPFRALSKLYDKAEFRTSVTPSIAIDVASLDSDGGGGPSPWMRLIRPTLILTGPEGRKVIAPAGEAGEHGGITGLILLGALLGVPFLLGRASR